MLKDDHVNLRFIIIIIITVKVFRMFYRFTELVARVRYVKQSENFLR